MGILDNLCAMTKARKLTPWCARKRGREKRGNLKIFTQQSTVTYNYLKIGLRKATRSGNVSVMLNM